MKKVTSESSIQTPKRVRIDLKKLEAVVEELEPLREQQRQQKQQQKKNPSQTGEFIRGPIPIWWVQKAAAISSVCGYLGIIIWHLHRLRAGDVRITTAIRTKYSLQRTTVRRHLRALQQAGLVSLYTHGHEAVRVTILATLNESTDTVQ